MPSQVGSKYASPFGVSLFPPGRFGLGPPVRTTPAKFGIGTVISYIAKPWPMAGSILPMKHGDFQEHTVTNYRSFKTKLISTRSANSKRFTVRI